MTQSLISIVCQGNSQKPRGVFSFQNDHRGLQAAAIYLRNILTQYIGVMLSVTQTQTKTHDLKTAIPVWTGIDQLLEWPATQDTNPKTN